MNLNWSRAGRRGRLVRQLLALVAATSLLALAACGDDTGDGASAGTDNGSSGTTDSGSSGNGSDGTEVKEGPGVTGSQITVGILSDYSGPIAEGATAGTVGMEIYFDRVNDEGGVCEREIVVEKQDTRYDAQLTVQGYRAIQNNVLMISQVVGTAGLMAIGDAIQEDNMATLSASMNTIVMEMPNVYVVLPAFEIELINGLVWAAEEAGASEENPVTVASVTSSDDFGGRYADAVAFAAEHTPGVELVESVNYAHTDEDFTAQVSRLMSSEADIVMLGTDPGKTAGFVGSAAQLGYDPVWVSTSGAWAAGIGQALDGLLDNYYVSGGYSTLSDDDDGIAALHEALATYAPDQKLDNFLVGGWLMAQATVAGLEAACDNGDLTREGVIAALQDLDVDYMGSAGDVNLGNGDQIVGFASRMNTIGEGGVQQALTDFFSTDAAEAWAQEKGF